MQHFAPSLEIPLNATSLKQSICCIKRDIIHLKEALKTRTAVIAVAHLQR